MISFLTTTRMPKGMLNTSMFHVRQREKHIIISDRSCHRHGRCFSTAPTMVKITSTTEQMRLTSRGFRRRNPTLVRQRRKPRPKTTTTTTQPTTNDIKPLLRWCIPFEFTLYRYIRVTYRQIKNQTYTRISFFFPNELIHIDDINEETIVCHTNNNNNNESSMDDSL